MAGEVMFRGHDFNSFFDLRRRWNTPKKEGSRETIVQSFFFSPCGIVVVRRKKERTNDALSLEKRKTKIQVTFSNVVNFQ